MQTTPTDRANPDLSPIEMPHREIATAISDALVNLDVQETTTRFRADNELLFLQRFLDPRWVETTLAKKARELLPRVHRGKVGSYKKSGSLSAFTLEEHAPEFIELYHSQELMNFFSELVGETLVLSPDTDPHACALYYYTEPGDHIGFHYDKSWYRGARYTVLIGLVQDTSHCLLECHPHKDEPQRETQELTLATTPGSLVLFNGDKLWHGVSPLAEGEQRIVLTLEYLTDSHMSTPKRWISNFKDAVAYFGLRGITRKR
ncbi:MAG: 2OG-Fe(II) oxygenase [Deltaproteobacteria bacterium]|nr:2OG-Fe(II) oxygenase [Deltaproteobacteria bacterium]